MGDCQTEPLRPQFDRRLRLEFHGVNVTSDAGLLAYRELDDALQLTDSSADELHDARTGRYREMKIPKFFRGDAAFASPKLFRFLEAESYWYAIRLKANAVLERQIAHLMKRPVGRPSKKPKVIYHSFRYQARSWDRSRQVVAKVEWHASELFPRVGFVVTDLRRSPKRVIKFYNGRGTAEQWIKEGKNAIKWTRLSCRRFKDNQARLPLFALAYNLGNFLRQLALPRPVRTWTLTTLREKLIKIGAKVVHHAKAVTFQLAEVAVPRVLFAAILGRIGRLRAAPGPG